MYGAGSEGLFVYTVYVLIVWMQLRAAVMYVASTSRNKAGGIRLYQMGGNISTAGTHSEQGV